MRPACVFLALFLILAACSEPFIFRAKRLRSLDTIFSPLPWAPPDSIRTAAGTPGPDYWQQRADYEIHASLDPATHMISATEIITYTNNSPHDLAYLWIHLEQNLARADSLGTQIEDERDDHSSPRQSQGVIIESIRALDDRAGTVSFTVHDTLARIELPAPISARGGQARLEVAWRLTLVEDETVRMGLNTESKDGPIYELAQWFPAVAVYDDVHGWNTLPYLGGGEFYSNFGAYDVRITLPREYLCAASGVLQNPQVVLTAEQVDRLQRAATSDEQEWIRSTDEVNDPASRPAGEGPLTWHFRGETMRTFAWAASPAFIWDAASVEIETQKGPTRILCQSMYPREVLPNWALSSRFIQHAVSFYSEFLTPYPYPQMANIYGTEGGMEYPMLIFCRDDGTAPDLFGVTDHEVAHTWFPMMVNNDERRHVWMDEGFNVFVNQYSTRAWCGEGEEDLEIDEVIRRMREPDQQSIMTPPDQMDSVGWLGYDKPAAGMVLLREVILGSDRFDRAFREFLRAWSFKSPQPEDFFRAIENSAGEDLAWFWRGWFYETSLLDQAITDAEVEWIDDASMWRVTITLRNCAEMVMPAPLRITYEDDSTEDRRVPVQIWFTRNEVEYSWFSAQRPVHIEIDPDHLLPDINRSNNLWRK